MAWQRASRSSGVLSDSNSGLDFGADGVERRGGVGGTMDRLDETRFAAALDQAIHDVHDPVNDAQVIRSFEV